MSVYKIDMQLENTLRVLEAGSYPKNGKAVTLKLSRKEMKECRIIYGATDESAKRIFSAKKINGNARCEFRCEKMDSFEMARKRYAQDPDWFAKKNDNSDHSWHAGSRILVLNFANAVNPGGGVRKGAKAQEEDLCRRSSLLVSLESYDAYSYYEFNRRQNTNMGSDLMIISPHVEIIKDEKGELLDETSVVAVLTCAAPNISRGLEGMSEYGYQTMLYKRITGMLRCAAHFGYTDLVLGAWGCGAFGNNARLVSALFCKAFAEIDFNGLKTSDVFHRVDFAIRDSYPGYNYGEFFNHFGAKYYSDGRYSDIRHISMKYISMK